MRKYLAYGVCTVEVAVLSGFRAPIRIVRHFPVVRDHDCTNKINLGRSLGVEKTLTNERIPSAQTYELSMSSENISLSYNPTMQNGS